MTHPIWTNASHLLAELLDEDVMCLGDALAAKARVGRGFRPKRRKVLMAELTACLEGRVDASALVLADVMDVLGVETWDGMPAWFEEMVAGLE